MPQLRKGRSAECRVWPDARGSGWRQPALHGTSSDGNDVRSGHHPHALRVRLRRGVRGGAIAARRQGRRTRGDDERSACPCPPASRSRPRPAAPSCAAEAKLPDGLEGEVAEHLAAAGGEQGQALRRPARPAALSVRSGAAISMPGMMDTILNLGLNDDVGARPRAATGNERFALGLLPAPDPDVRRGRRRDRRRALRGASWPRQARRRGAEADLELSADDLDELIETFRAIVRERTGRPFPQDAARATRARRRAPSSAPGIARAPRATAAPTSIPDDLGTAVNVVQHGLRQQGRRLGDRRLLHAQPGHGRARAYGEYLLDAQGEDVVAGIRTPEPARATARADAGGIRRARRDAASARSATTATCRTSSSRSRTAGCTCSRRARPSGRRRQRSRRPSR